MPETTSAGCETREWAAPPDMPRFSVTRKSAFTPQQLYNVVANIEAYPKFVPLCRAATLSDLRTDEAGHSHAYVVLHIQYDKLALAETLKCQVVFDASRLSIRSTSNRPPLKHLDGIWRFHASPDGGCEVVYTVDYQLVSRSLQLLLSGMFDWAARKLLAAFEARAVELYGRPLARAS